MPWENKYTFSPNGKISNSISSSRQSKCQSLSLECASPIIFLENSSSSFLRCSNATSSVKACLVTPDCNSLPTMPLIVLHACFSLAFVASNHGGLLSCLLPPLDYKILKERSMCFSTVRSQDLILYLMLDMG